MTDISGVCKQISSQRVQIELLLVHLHTYNCHDLSSSYFSSNFEYITNSPSDQIPVGLIAELVEHCTGIAVSDHGLVSNTVQA